MKELRQRLEKAAEQQSPIVQRRRTPNLHGVGMNGDVTGHTEVRMNGDVTRHTEVRMHTLPYFLLIVIAIVASCFFLL